MQNLLYYGADVNAEGSDGQTALLEAVENEHLHILQVVPFPYLYRDLYPLSY